MPIGVTVIVSPPISGSFATKFYMNNNLWLELYPSTKPYTQIGTGVPDGINDFQITGPSSSAQFKIINEVTGQVIFDQTWFSDISFGTGLFVFDTTGGGIIRPKNVGVKQVLIPHPNAGQTLIDYVSGFIGQYQHASTLADLGLSGKYPQGSQVLAINALYNLPDTETYSVTIKIPTDATQTITVPETAAEKLLPYTPPTVFDASYSYLGQPISTAAYLANPTNSPIVSLSGGSQITPTPLPPSPVALPNQSNAKTFVITAENGLTKSFVLSVNDYLTLITQTRPTEQITNLSDLVATNPNTLQSVISFLNSNLIPVSNPPNPVIQPPSGTITNPIPQTGPKLSISPLGVGIALAAAVGFALLMSSGKGKKKITA
jgi:hypothetical protein